MVGKTLIIFKLRRDVASKHCKNYQSIDLKSALKCVQSKTLYKELFNFH